MAISIPGYDIGKEVYESANSLVYRGQRRADNQPIILKMLKQAYPSPEKIAWFKREYEITRNLNPSTNPEQALTGVVAAYSLENHQQRWIMVMEDFGGISLAQLKLTDTLALTDFLTLAIQITDILSQIHQQNIIHKDLNPTNIVFNPDHGQVKIIDFGISTVLSQENPTFRSPNVLEGTLAYISPEQTGRMNRVVDYRTDFYSLGATLYELLTGQLPFPTTDVMELVHAHIAKRPLPPHKLKPDIPHTLSSIIMKLLAKNAEDRYQSAYGLKQDLERCLQQWQTTGKIEPFPLAQHDISGRFQIPQKLYGREQEIKMLLAAFERVATGSTDATDTEKQKSATVLTRVEEDPQSKIQNLKPVPSAGSGQALSKAEGSKIEMTLVLGYAGIGKSALVQEIYKPITHQRGYFISGNFDQFQRNTPYLSLIQALASLIRQLLTESEAQIAAWREKLLAALGPNAQIIIDVIPEVELIIGPQPAVAELPPGEAQNRFNLVFQNFIRVFGRPEHPLVIFLDDLQWVDSASLNLIKLMMTDPDTRHLFLIGAYRDNEVKVGHPFLLTLDEIRKVGVAVNQIVLSPLDLPNITQFIADTLNSSPERISPLAKLVLAKTNGNPFFISEFLKSLYTEKLLTFSFQRGHWQWDLAQIQAQDITDNVIELMTRKVQQLQPATQEVLKLAACIGNQFDLDTLAIVYKKSPPQTATDLWEAIAAGLVLPLSDTYKLAELDVPDLADEMTPEYKFTHDRIQQAVYSLIPQADKQAIHWQVGQLVLQHIPADKREQKIFDIVSHLNLGLESIDTQPGRDKIAIQLAELNLMAGKKAKTSVAYEPALNCLQIGIDLLASLDEEDTWQKQYDLTLALHVEAAEAAYLSGNFATMETLAEVVLKQARKLLDKARIYDIKISAYQAQNRPLDSIKTALPILKLLGFRFPKQPNMLHILLGLLETKLILLGKKPEDLLNLPRMTAPDKLAAMRILMNVTAASYIAIPDLLPLLLFKMVNLSVKHGNAPSSTVAYAGYGLILCGAVGDIENGYKFGQLGLRLVDQLQAKEFQARTVVIVNGFIKHWKEHARDSLPALLEAYQYGLETGDLEYAALGPYMYSFEAFVVGRELPGLEQEMASYHEVIAQLKQETFLNYHRIYRQAIANLQGQAENPALLVGEYYDEEQMFQYYQEVKDISGITSLHVEKLILRYLFHMYPQALEIAATAEKSLDSVMGALDVALFYFYDSLTRLAIYPNVQKAEQKRFIKKVAANQKKLKKWAKHAPTNFQHKFCLVEAERARVLGHDEKARDYYEQAINLARENKYIHEEALAHELAGKYYLDKGQPKFAQVYVRDAHYAYLRWGAIAKVQDLEQRYPQLLAWTAERSGSTTKTTSSVTLTTKPRSITTTTAPALTSRQHQSSTLDLASVVKALQAISSEIEKNKLLRTLMKIVIENGGAQKGYLILEKNDQLSLEAAGSAAGEDLATPVQSIPLEIAAYGRTPLLPPTLINYVAHTQKPVVLNDAAYEGQFAQDKYIITYQPKSILCAPLINQGKLIGMLYLENNLTTGAFTEDRLQVLNLLSAQAAISIENAQLYTNLQSSEQKYRALFEESKDTIYMTAPNGKIIDVNPAGLTLFGYTREEVTLLTAQDLYTNPEDRLRFLHEIEQHGSVRNFEVKFSKKNGDVIDCSVTATVRQAEDGTILGFQGIIRDITAQKRAEQERLRLTAIERELTLAQEIQQSLLPPTNPGWTDLDVACYSTPAREMGGDFYSYHAFSPNREGTSTLLHNRGGKYALAVGDVSGKGVSAALLMSTSLSQFDAALSLDLTPAERLVHLDQAIVPYTKSHRQNCALCYIELELDPKDFEKPSGLARLRAANAGCIPPYIKRETGEVKELDVGGFALGQGLGSQIGYQEVSINLTTGDMVILTSDGVVEANNADGEMFGFERLKQAIATGPTTSAKAMLEHLKVQAATFATGAEPHDDLTIVVVQV